MGNEKSLTIEKSGSDLLNRLRGAEYQTVYDGQVRIKFIDKDSATGDPVHEYWVSEKEEKPYRNSAKHTSLIKRSGWSDWRRVYGPTTYIEIKDKSHTLVDWALGVFHRYLLEVLSTRMVNKFDLELGRGLPEDNKKKAGNIGTIAHKWMDDHIIGLFPEMPEHDGVKQIITYFFQWKNELGVEFISPDLLLYSKKYDFCGKADAIVRIGGKIYLLDFKTGSGIYNDAMLQTAAYVEMYNEMGYDKKFGPLAGRIVSRFEKRTEEEFRTEMTAKKRPNAIYRPITTLFFDNSPDQLKDDFTAFLAAKSLWEWNKRSERALKKIKEAAQI